MAARFSRLSKHHSNLASFVTKCLFVHRLVGGDDRRLDIGEDDGEPVKRRMAGTVATATGDDGTMIATGVCQPKKTGAPVGHHERVGRDDAFGQRRHPPALEARDAADLEAAGLAAGVMRSLRGLTDGTKWSGILTQANRSWLRGHKLPPTRPTAPA